MSDTLQFVVVIGESLAAMLLGSSASRRQTEVCRTSPSQPAILFPMIESSHKH